MKGKVAVPNKPMVSVDVGQHFEKPHQDLSPGMVWTIDLCTGDVQVHGLERVVELGSHNQLDRSLLQLSTAGCPDSVT